MYVIQREEIKLLRGWWRLDLGGSMRSWSRGWLEGEGGDTELACCNRVSCWVGVRDCAIGCGRVLDTPFLLELEHELHTLTQKHSKA
jgi:hypothetical protein